MTTTVPRLSAALPVAQGKARPTPRIIQFGEGNFLRAFFDWKVDRLNEAAGADWGVVVVRPKASGATGQDRTRSARKSTAARKKTRRLYAASAPPLRCP